MAKLSIISLFSSFFVVSLLLPLTYSQTQVTNVRIYFQDQFNASQPAYGDVYAFEGPLTVGANPNSTLLGRAQGTIAFTTLDASFDFHMSVAYIFTSGVYNGSTVIAVGRNDVKQGFRQYPIVGGTGAFRLSRGIVTGNTISTQPVIHVFDLKIIQDQVGSGIEMKNV